MNNRQNHTSTSTTDILGRCNKDTLLTAVRKTNLPKLSDRQLFVYNLLLKSKKTVTQLTNITGFSDPRGYVRDLRKKGITVLDEWIQRDDVRFKRYWIPAEQ